LAGNGRILRSHLVPQTEGVEIQDKKRVPLAKPRAAAEAGLRQYAHNAPSIFN
jgi:hypothetical protein